MHGAKGLEAPIVFLPDTMALPKTAETLLWTERDQLPLWRPRAELRGRRYAAEREALRRRELQEYRRLLYVALTRAQDRLYVCGWQTRDAPPGSLLACALPGRASPDRPAVRLRRGRR